MSVINHGGMVREGSRVVLAVVGLEDDRLPAGGDCWRADLVGHCAEEAQVD